MEENKAATPKIFPAMVAIMREIKAVAKTQNNTQQGYVFRGIDDVYNALQPLLQKHGVFITTKLLNSKREERTTQKGGTLIFTILEIENRFWAEDGSSVESTSQGEAMDSGDKGSNKAMSAAQKYSLIQTFAIPTKEGSMDTEKDPAGSAEELKFLLEESDKITELQTLVDWANDQTEWNKNKEFIKHVTGNINKLKKQIKEQTK